MRRSRPGPPTWWAALAGLALPVACPGCGAPDVPVCHRCLRECAPSVRRVRPPWGPSGVATVVAGEYTGALRRLVVAWKDHGRLDLGDLLAQGLAAALVAQLDDLARAAGVGPRIGGRVRLVPVPSSSSAVRRRGEDVVAELAARAAGLLGAPGGPGRPGVDRALAQRVGVADQAGLDRHARRSNVADAFVVRRVPRGPVLLVDDVVTTGASAAAAVAALRRAGAVVLGVCAVSATPARRPLSRRPELG